MKRPAHHPTPAQAVHEAREAADEARRLLDSPAFRKACKAIQDRAIQVIRTSPTSDIEGRQGAYFMLRAMDALATELAGAISGAAVTRHNFRHIISDEDDKS